jgi:hypothetical protein
LVGPSDLRYGAESAMIGATFCDLKVGDKRRSGKDSGSLFIVEKSGSGKKSLFPPLPFQDLGQVLKGSSADEKVHLR